MELERARVLSAEARRVLSDLNIGECISIMELERARVLSAEARHVLSDLNIGECISIIQSLIS